MAKSLNPFLMFEGAAEEAMTFYMSLFDDSEITSIQKYAGDDGGPAGTIKHAAFTLGGREFQCSDSPIEHGFTFTPSTSIFVECDDIGELERLFTALSDGGSVMMPLDNYGFSERFAWVADRFGVSWQLNLGGTGETM